ncbi:unnamed protein product [Closterium sp. NIES-64]|nr:unnamed protein product [Closterium sp. NIES-64]
MVQTQPTISPASIFLLAAALVPSKSQPDAAAAAAAAAAVPAAVAFAAVVAAVAAATVAAACVADLARAAATPADLLSAGVQFYQKPSHQSQLKLNLPYPAGLLSAGLLSAGARFYQHPIDRKIGARDSSSSVSPDIFPFFYTALLLLPVILVLVRFYIRSRVKRHSFGFFHPFTNDGGGGERVLWCAVRAIQVLRKSYRCLIKASRCLIKASRYPRFTLLGQSLQHSLSHNPCASPPLSPFQTLVVRLCYRHLVEASLYPRFTLLGQSLQHSLSHDPRASPPLSHLLTQVVRLSYPI